MTYADGFWFGLGFCAAVFVAVWALCIGALIITALMRKTR